MTACRSQVAAEIFRVALALPDGTPDPGSENAYQTGSLVEVSWAPVTDVRAAITRRATNGSYCVVRPAKTRVIGYTLTVELCSWDYRLGGLLTGGTVTVDDDDNIVGLLDPSINADDSARLIVEVFSDAQALDVPGDPPYIRDVFGLCTRFVPDTKTLNDADSTYKLVSQVSPNPNFGDGPFNDMPELWAYGEVLHYERDDDTLPEATCGYVLEPAS